MAKFSYEMTDKDAKLAVKRAINGKVPVSKDNGKEIKLGPPMMKVTVTFRNGICETTGSLFGKALIGTVDNCIELAEGFTRV